MALVSYHIHKQMLLKTKERLKDVKNTDMERTV